MKTQRTDEQLLECFLTGDREELEGAFASLLTRHGPLVMGVCRQVLKHEQDAEDAFQATFLALARKAARIRNPRVLGSWLAAVASRTALRLRARVARRRPLRGLSGGEVSLGDAESHAIRNEARSIVHAELAHLPDECRTLLGQCYLEGKTNEEVARLLGCPVGTVKGRLWRARGMLRERLIRRGGREVDQLALAR
jgi:RNA polymerase sigma factor (sigma-70 family)